MTYKFVFDPRVNAVLPLSVHPGRPPVRRRRGSAIDLALLTLAVVASVFAFTVMRAATSSAAASPVGASITAASR